MIMISTAPLLVAAALVPPLYSAHSVAPTSVASQPFATPAGDSVSSAISLGSSGLKVLKPVRNNSSEQSVMAQRGLIDATRTIGQSAVKFGVAGSLPLAPTQSHLLLRGTGKKANIAGLK